jgi:hypothetical protein
VSPFIRKWLINIVFIVGVIAGYQNFAPAESEPLRPKRAKLPLNFNQC